MFFASVDITLVLLCTAVAAYFASSLTVTAKAPITNPPVKNTSLLRLLFLGIGLIFEIVLRSVVNEIRCCRGNPCRKRHARHVQGAGRRRKGDTFMTPDIMSSYSKGIGSAPSGTASGRRLQRCTEEGNGKCGAGDFPKTLVAGRIWIETKTSEHPLSLGKNPTIFLIFIKNGVFRGALQVIYAIHSPLSIKQQPSNQPSTAVQICPRNAKNQCGKLTGTEIRLASNSTPPCSHRTSS